MWGKTKKICQRTSASFHSFSSHPLLKYAVKETTCFYNQAILYPHSFQSPGNMLWCSSAKWISHYNIFWNKKNKKNSHLRNMRNLSFPVWNLPTCSSSAKMVNPAMEEKIFYAQHCWRASNLYITLKICLKNQVKISLPSAADGGIMPNQLNAKGSICLKI